MTAFKIGNRHVAPQAPCLIMAEVAQAHEGSLGMAHAYIDAAARAGADAIKFQTHIAAAESTPAEPWRVKFSTQDETRFDYWKRMEFTLSQWQELKQHADDAGLFFFSSPFSGEALELLVQIGVPAWKVPSGETSNTMLLDHMIATERPVILSTGMSDFDEIDKAVARLRQAGRPFAVMQCTSDYPCPPERVGLNLIPDLRQRYNCAIGLSDHSGEIFPGLAAAAIGIEIIEVHVTFSREMFGADVAASLTFEELSQLVRGIRYIETMHHNPVDKSQMAADLRPLRQTFTKSLVARKDLKAGTALEKEHLVAKKPGTGIPVSRIEEVLGRRLKRSVDADEILSEGDLENGV